MKQGTGKIFAAAAILLGALHLADLLWLTDPATGFLTGSVWLRYGVLAAFVLLCMLCTRGGSTQVLHEPPQLPRLVLWGTALLSGIAGVLVETNALSGFAIAARAQGAQRVLLLVVAVLWLLVGLALLLLCAWLAVLALRGFSCAPLPLITTLISCGFMALVIVRYCERVASVFRMLPMLQTLGAIAAMLFFVKFSGLHGLPCTQSAARRVQASGMILFSLCTCIGMPQAVWQFVYRQLALHELVLALALGMLGVLGLCVAQQLAKYEAQ